VLAPWLEAAPSTVDVPAAGGATSPALEATAGSVDWLALGLPWLVAGWLVGVGVLSVRLIGGWALTRRMVAVGTRVSEAWQDRFDALCGRMHVEQAVQFLQTSRVSGPVVIGWLRPVVLVPAGLLAGLPPAQVELILLHELAHIRRHDYLVNLLQSMAEVALFFHPVAWWASKQIRKAREEACDELVVRVGQDRVGYARALTVLEERRFGMRLALGSQDGALGQRIRRILGVAPSEPGQSGWVLGILAVICLGLAASLWASPMKAAGEHAQAEHPVFTHTTLEAAMEEAQREGKPIFLFLYEDEYTGGFEATRTLWDNAQLASFLREQFVTLLVNGRSEEGKRLIDLYHITVLHIEGGEVVRAPLVGLLGPDGYRHVWEDLPRHAGRSPGDAVDVHALITSWSNRIHPTMRRYFTQPVAYDRLDRAEWARSLEYMLDFPVRASMYGTSDTPPIELVPERQARYLALQAELEAAGTSADEAYATREALVIAQRLYMEALVDGLNMSIKNADGVRPLITEREWQHVADIQRYLAAMRPHESSGLVMTDMQTLLRMRHLSAWLLALRGQDLPYVVRWNVSD
ncbi:MAG: M56 family metallopeptidase, partial [Bacteroidota bacterium]